jgi:hypothetical protein
MNFTYGIERTKQGDHMYFQFLLAIVFGAIVYGLIRFTERTLEIRQQRRDQGDDPKVYL